MTVGAVSWMGMRIHKWWALQVQKWRNYFHIPDDLPLSSSSASSGAVDGPIGEHEEQGAQGQKRNAEEAGLELN